MNFLGKPTQSFTFLWYLPPIAGAPACFITAQDTSLCCATQGFNAREHFRGTGRQLCSLPFQDGQGFLSHQIAQIGGLNTGATNDTGWKVAWWSSICCEGDFDLSGTWWARVLLCKTGFIFHKFHWNVHTIYQSCSWKPAICPYKVINIPHYVEHVTLWE